MRLSLRTAAPIVTLLITAVSLPVGCKGACGGGDNAGPSSSGSSSATASAPVASASAPRPKNLIRAGGSTGTILRAVQSLTLNDEQKATMDQIATDLHSTNGPEEQDGGIRSEMRDMHADLIAGVKAGKIDTAKMDAHQAALEKLGRSRRLAEADALNKAWKVLDDGQRKSVVSSVRAMEDKRMARMRRRDGGVGNLARLKFEHYTKDLDLDADQQKKVTALMPKDDKNAVDPADEAKKQLDDVLAAFEAGDFDARKFESADGLKKRLNPMADTVKFLSQLMPILKPAQQEKLAGQMDKDRGSPGEHRPHRGGGEDEDLLSW
jgi:Spy/CpxP family protein refolding chaperone